MRAVASLVAAVACKAATPRPPLRMKEVQVIGSHNSFTARIPDAVLAAIRARAPQEAEALNCDHLPLTAQLDRGGHDARVRSHGNAATGVQGLSHHRYRLSVGLRDLSPVSEGNRHMVARASRTSADHDHHQRRRHTVGAGGDQRPAAADRAIAHRADHPLLRGRPIFGWYDPATPEGAMQIVQDPLVNGAKIRDWVRQGVILRTRSDLPTTDARTGSHARGGERSAVGQHR